MAELALLRKCEDFLLHPTVRALSLAQRVDFLERKGLSPQQITRCLQSVERRNGLSQLARRSGEQLAAAAPAASPLLRLLRKVAPPALLLTLLAVGYAQLRRREAQRRALEQQVQRLQRRSRASAKVEALLAVVRQQQTQYQQAAELLRTRAARYLARQAEQSPKAGTTATQFTRGLELQALRSELLELKTAVVDTYIHPPTEKAEKKDIPMLLRPADVSVAEMLKATESRRESVKEDRGDSSKVAVGSLKQREALDIHQEDKQTDEKQSAVRDQTTMSSAELTELFERGQIDEELSTARSYRILFATQ